MPFLATSIIPLEKGSPHKDPDAGYDHDRSSGSDSGADGRIQKVNGIVTDTNDQIRYGQGK
jgi:hypothetical protein